MAFSTYCRARCQTLSGQLIEAEDVENTAYARYADAYGDTKPVSEAKPLLYRIAQNYIRECYKKAQSERTALSEWSALHDESQESQVEEIAEREAHSHLMRAILPEIIELFQTLPYLRVACYVLHRCCGIPYHRIAGSFKEISHMSVDSAHLSESILCVLRAFHHELEGPAADILKMLRATPDDIQVLSNGLGEHGNLFWNSDNDSQYPVLRSWVTRVHKAVKSHIHT